MEHYGSAKTAETRVRVSEEKIIYRWNRLLRDMVDSPSLAAFGSRLMSRSRRDATTQTVVKGLMEKLLHDVLWFALFKRSS